MQKDIKDVLERVNSGSYSREDETVVKYWIHQCHQDDEVQLSKDEWLVMKNKIWSGLELRQELKMPPTKRLWVRIGIAVAVTTIIFGAGLFFYKKAQNDLTANTVYNQDIAPGRSGATLTLANGKKINLSGVSSGNIANESGITVTKTTDGRLVYEIDGASTNPNQLNMLATGKGESYILILPDKSQVWMNAASSLTYSPSLLREGVRKVVLTGEAYFQISKDPLHPFIVETKSQRVQVLGTEFNINAYEDEPAILTTLIHGSIKLNVDKKQMFLKPGQQAVNNGTEVSIENANIDNVTDWKNNEINLNNISFKEGMRKVARWYDVEVIYSSSIPNDLRIGGWISRTEKLSSILKSIESAGIVKFDVKGRKIYVTK